ncbi:hypothetical protein, partial [Piscirickettsia litoralis]|uniref:hypothetical protein n=1 Tax=Piscirickettsia litoralis TaxID=1891921 RepID=UPI001300D7F8
LEKSKFSSKAGDRVYFSSEAEGFKNITGRGDFLKKLEGSWELINDITGNKIYSTLKLLESLERSIHNPIKKILMTH